MRNDETFQGNQRHLMPGSMQQGAWDSKDASLNVHKKDDFTFMVYLTVVVRDILEREKKKRLRTNYQMQNYLENHILFSR